MPENEFERFAQTAKELRGKQNSQIVSLEESRLLDEISRVFDWDERERCETLYARFRQNDLNEAEHGELLESSDKTETQNARRSELLNESARVRGQSFRKTARDLKIKNAGVSRFRQNYAKRLLNVPPEFASIAV